MLTFYGVGMILGAGIYSIIGKAAGIAGENLWQGFVLAAVAAFFTALSYAELATMYPKAGAEYFYLKNAFPNKRRIATTVGVMMFFAGSATAATVATAFADYLDHFIAVPIVSIAAGLLFFFTVINIVGIRESAWFNVVFTLIEMGGLVLFIVIGARSPSFGAALTTLPTFATVSSAALIIFAYFGFENIVNLSEETQHPERTVPRAILLSLALSTILYLLVSIAAVALLAPEQLATSEAPLVDAAVMRSPTIAAVLGAVALFSTANTALIALITASRILFGVANDGVLPSVLARTFPRRKTPWVAACAALCVALLLLPLGAVEIIASVSSLATMSAFIAVNTALIALRLRDPDRPRPFRVPLTIGRIPLFPIAGAAIAAIFLLQFPAKVYGVGACGFIIAVSLTYIKKRG